MALETILKLGNPTNSKSRFTKSFSNGTICPLNQGLTRDPLGGIERPHTSYQIFCPSIILKWPLSKWIVKTLLDVKGRSGTIMENCLFWKERYNKSVNCLCSRTTSVFFLLRTEQFAQGLRHRVTAKSSGETIQLLHSNSQ